MFDQQNVAVKRIMREKCEIAFREVSLLRKLKWHPNVLRYYYMVRQLICIYSVKF